MGSSGAGRVRKTRAWLSVGPGLRRQGVRRGSEGRGRAVGGAGRRDVPVRARGEDRW